MWQILNIDTGKTRDGFDSSEEAEDFIQSFYGQKGVITEYDTANKSVKYYLEKQAC